MRGRDPREAAWHHLKRLIEPTALGYQKWPPLAHTWPTWQPPQGGRPVLPVQVPAQRAQKGDHRGESSPGCGPGTGRRAPPAQRWLRRLAESQRPAPPFLAASNGTRYRSRRVSPARRGRNLATGGGFRSTRSGAPISAMCTQPDAVGRPMSLACRIGRCQSVDV